MRKIETGETFPGAKVVLLEKTREELTAQQAEIVDIGASAFCDDEDCPRPHEEGVIRGREVRTHDFPAHMGDWVLLAPRALTEGPDNCYFVNQDDVLAVLSQ